MSRGQVVDHDISGIAEHRLEGAGAHHRVHGHQQVPDERFAIPFRLKVHFESDGLELVQSSLEVFLGGAHEVPRGSSRGGKGK